MYSLRIENEKGEIRRIDVEKDSYSIGRLNENDLVLPDINVSRRHAIIETRPEGLVLVDPGSRYGIRMGGTQNPPEVLLQGGDIFVLGDYRIELIPTEADVLPAASATIRMTSMREEDIVSADDVHEELPAASALLEEAVGVPYTVAVSEDETLKVLLEMRRRSLTGAGMQVAGGDEAFGLDVPTEDERRKTVRRSLLVTLMIAAIVLIGWLLYSYWASSELNLGRIEPVERPGRAPAVLVFPSRPA